MDRWCGAISCGSKKHDVGRLVHSGSWGQKTTTGFGQRPVTLKQGKASPSSLGLGFSIGPVGQRAKSVGLFYESTFG
jgi:hypothetical protein